MKDGFCDPRLLWGVRHPQPTIRKIVVQYLRFGFLGWILELIPFPMPSLRTSVLTIAAVCLSLGVRARGQDDIANYKMPVPPPGTNPAVYAAPRLDWIVRFQHNVERARQGNVDLLFDGDSITDGWQGAGKDVWAANYGKLNAADFGIGGDRTEHVLWRLEHGQAAGLHPKLIALMIGTNNTGGLTDVQIAEGITADVRAYQKICPDAIILLQAVFPRAEKPTDPVRAKIKGINTAIAKLADGKKVIYMDFGDKFLQPDGTLTKDIMPDFLHPNAKGYQIWADAIRPEIEKVFGPAK